MPDNDPGIVTHELVIPFYWRETMGNIRVGESVYYLEDESMGGYVIGRCDGEWDGTIRGSLTVMEDVTGKVSVWPNIRIRIPKMERLHLRNRLHYLSF